jgi:hypothetical protein
MSQTTISNAVEQVSRIFVTQGVRSQTVEGQLVFVVDGCGCSRASFRLFQDGFIVVLIGEFGFDALLERRAALASFAIGQIILCCRMGTWR